MTNTRSLSEVLKGDKSINDLSPAVKKQEKAAEVDTTWFGHDEAAKRDKAIPLYFIGVLRGSIGETKAILRKGLRYESTISFDFSGTNTLWILCAEDFVQDTISYMTKVLKCINLQHAPLLENFNEGHEKPR